MLWQKQKSTNKESVNSNDQRRDWHSSLTMCYLRPSTDKGKGQFYY